MALLDKKDVRVEQGEQQTSDYLGNHDDYVQDDDVSLAREMNTLSVQQREQIYEEIHGIAGNIAETPELVSASLDNMRRELAIVPRRRRAALDRAFFLRPSIAYDDSFHLMFLRACRFNPEDAAMRMHRYFTNKLALFGEEKLTKKISLDDLGEKEIKLMHQGSTQFLQVSHRGVIAQYTMIAALDDVSDWKVNMRYLWYQLMAALEDEEVQKRGIIEVWNLRGPWKVGVHDMQRHLVKCNLMLNDRPVKICAFHRLVEGGPLSYFIGTANKLMPKEHRIRQRFHDGSDLEIKYALMTFGVNLPDCFTLGCGMFAKAQLENGYLQFRSLAEDKFNRLETQKLLPNHALFPSRDDVLMGRGRPFQTWPGNFHLAQLVMENAEHYLKAKCRDDKTEIARQILTLVRRQNGGRFLRRTSVDWEPVDELAARNKISQLLRAEVRSRQRRAIHGARCAYDGKRVGPYSKSKRLSVA